MRQIRRSDINFLVRSAAACFEAHGWALPPDPRWDVTDFGLGDWRRHGLVLVNLAEEPEYCEKLMYARSGMVTPTHTHHRKKEDIVCRWGALRVDLAGLDGLAVKLNGQALSAAGSEHTLELTAGERVTIVPGIWHSFQPLTDEVVIGEVSTANDDLHDNLFADPGVGRFPEILEDEAALVRLVSER